MNNLFSKAEEMKTQSENKRMQQWCFCSVPLKEREGKGGDAKSSLSTHPHTDTSFTPKGSLFRALEELLLYKDLCIMKSKASQCWTAGYLGTPTQALSGCSFCTLAGDIGSDSFFQSHVILAEEQDLACSYVYLLGSLSLNS